eukprot:103470_1
MESLVVKNQLILCVFTAPIKLQWTKQSDLIFAPSTLNNESIHAILCVYNKICGIITIKPPSEWNPIFNLSFDDFKFSTKIQPLHLLEKRIGGIVTSEMDLFNFKMKII